VTVLTLLHASDLHFGRPHHAAAAHDFHAFVHREPPDVLVFSGDFTQRAKIHEYEAARAWLDTLPDVPTVVTPGNHDVPLYRVLERLGAPYRNYRRYISADLDTVTRVPGAIVVSLNSAAPHRAIVNGRIRTEQLTFARQAFAASERSDLRVVVAHHHLAPAPDYEGDRPLPGGRHILDALEGMGVELALGGHLHRAYIGNSLDVYPGEDRDRGIVIVQSGTTTSHRGRARERAKNSFNRIEVDADRIRITHFLRFEGGFMPFSEHMFPRRPRRWLGEGGDAP
jgi:3',5'-cyclic AMP phosphodiesterase CpdA